MGLVPGAKKEHTYTVDPSRLLCLCERAKRKKRGAKSKDNYFFIHFSFSAFTRHLALAPSHLVTLSARASTLGGIMRPICLLRRQKCLCLLKLGPLGIGIFSQHEKFFVIALRLPLISSKCRGFARAIEATKTVGIVLLGGFECLQRFRWPIHFEQHVTQKFPRRYDPARGYRAFLAFVLQIRSGAHQRECFLVAAFCIGDPSGRAQTLHLYFGRPIVVFRSLERTDDARKFLDIFVGGGRIAATGGAEGAGKIGHRFGIRESARPRLKLHRLFPSPPLDRVARRYRREGVWSGAGRERAGNARCFLGDESRLAVTR